MQQEREEITAHRNRMRLVSLFCGGGCFSSAAAELEGVEVVLGVDSWGVGVQTFRENHPTARIEARTLPCAFTELALPSVRNVHLQLSPPCVAFSSSRRGRESEDEVALGVRLLAWSVEFAVRHGFGSFSVENVATEGVYHVFERVRAAHAGKFDFCEVEAGKLGGCSDRTRLVGGSPPLVDRLKAAPNRPICTIRQAFDAAGAPIPTGATHVRNCSGRVKSGETVFSLRDAATERALTVVASRALVFCDASGATVRQLSPRESAVLMGVSRIKLPPKAKDALRVVGNGVEGNTAKAVLTAAMEALGADPPEPPEPPAPPDRAAIDAAITESVDGHVRWFAERKRARETVLQRAAREGVARGKVLKIFNALASSCTTPGLPPNSPSKD